MPSPAARCEVLPSRWSSAFAGAVETPQVCVTAGQRPGTTTSHPPPIGTPSYGTLLGCSERRSLSLAVARATVGTQGLDYPPPR